MKMAKDREEFIFMIKKLWAVLWVAFLVLIDQGSKQLAKDKLEGKEPFIIFPNIFQLRYLENRGAAFGIMQGKQFVLVIITILALLVIIYFYIKIPNGKRYVPIKLIAIFIMAGAIGNFIDRIIYGYVIDFFYIELINFPIFNVADCYVTIGAITSMILILFYYKEEDLTFLMKDYKTK